VQQMDEKLKANQGIKETWKFFVVEKLFCGNQNFLVSSFHRSFLEAMRNEIWICLRFFHGISRFNEINPFFLIECLNYILMTLYTEKVFHYDLFIHIFDIGLDGMQRELWKVRKIMNFLHFKKPSLAPWWKVLMKTSSSFYVNSRRDSVKNLLLLSWKISMLRATTRRW
jgi:hypothetical protein